MSKSVMSKNVMSNRNWATLLLLLVFVVLLARAIVPAPDALLGPAIDVLLLVALAGGYLLYRRFAAQLAGELQESEQFIRTIVDGIADPVTIIDKDFRVTTANKAARSALCIDSNADEPVHCYRAIHGLDHPCDPSQRTCAMLSGESSKEIRSVVNDAGQQRLVETRSTPLRDASGQLTGVIEVEHDLNEQEKVALRLQRAQEDLDTAIRAKSELLATISHEVRTPMNAILGMTDLLQLTNLKRKQRNYTQIIESSGNMLLSLVDNMLDYTTLDSGTLVLHEEEFSVSELLERVLEVMGYQAYSKDLELIGAVDGDFQQRVSADLQHLRQIMINLVGNAIKFTNRGEILVRVGVDAGEEGRGRLTVTVSDSGIGISQTAAARLFTPFARAATADHAKHQEGSGLGLTICKQLADLMGGKIGIETELGAGTQARLSVPVSIIQAADNDATHRTLALRNHRVLVAAKNTVVANVICDYLTSWGMQGESVSLSGEVSACLATAAVEGAAFDAAIIDYDLLEADGLSLARDLRARGNYLPIVLLTSIARPLEVGEIAPLGAVRCVNKPILPSDLRHDLFSVLKVDDRPGKHAAGDEQRPLGILIAEDNPLNRTILSRMLESLGHSVDCVTDGSEALSAIQKKSYALIFMDCQMPGLDGDEVTRRIRQLPEQKFRQPIIVAVTADISAELRSKCLQAGMDDFLAKPVRLEELKSSLQRWSALAGADPAGVDRTADPSGVEPDQKIIAHLRDRAGSDGAAFVSGYVDLFLKDSAMRLQVMAAAAEREDQITLGRECHALKGACLELGAAQMGACCDALRDASKAGDFAEVPAALLRLRDEFEYLKPIFEAGKYRLA